MSDKATTANEHGEDVPGGEATTDIADRLWDSDDASALTKEGAREIERLRDQSASRWAEIQRLRETLRDIARRACAGIQELPVSPATGVLAEIAQMADAEAPTHAGS